MKPTVFTYYEPIPLWSVHAQIEIWRHSWTKHGWKAVTLGRDVARRHPCHNRLQALTRSWPTLNDRRYEEACYMRWCAFAVVVALTGQRCLMSDYDVLNRGFSPAMLGQADVIMHERTRVPCLVEATTKGAEEIVQFLLSRAPAAGAGHYSDMIALKESSFPISGLCLEWGDGPWQTAPAVHVATFACQREANGRDKTLCMRELA